MATLKVDVTEVRVAMARANITQQQLSEYSKIHANTISRILREEIADLKTVAALTVGLNVALERVNMPLLGPFDILKPEGFPAPQMEASAQPV